jgi:hypothetical protein
MPVQCICPVCGSAFSVKPSHASKRRFCSSECRLAGGWRKRNTLADRFWPRVNKDGPIPEHRPEIGPCWLWTGAKDGVGYGHISTGGKARNGGRMIGTHVASIIIHDGSIPDGLRALHHCDNRLCVRRSHLFVGTQQDNIRDMHTKGRAGTPQRRRGPDNLNAKLTYEQVAEIRAAYAAGGISQPQLGCRYGVSHSTIGLIVRNRAWRS